MDVFSILALRGIITHVGHYSCASILPLTMVRLPNELLSRGRSCPRLLNGVRKLVVSGLVLITGFITIYLNLRLVVRSGFIDIYPGQQIIGEEMQNAPQEETHGVLGNTLDAGALRSLNWPVEGPDLYACLEINPEQPKARNRLAHLDLKQPK